MNTTLSNVLQIVGIIVLAMIAFKVISIVLGGVMLLVKLALVAGICLVAYGAIRKLL